MAGGASRPRLPDSLAHAALSRALDAFRPGPALCVDATAGNGHDALFLAGHAPPGSLLILCDIQPAALEATERRLLGAGIPPSIRRLPLGDGHERIAAHLDALPPEDAALPLAAAVFNLGWLPGGPREIVTRPETSRAAASALLERLAPRGVLCLHCYTGHPGGAEEEEAILDLVRALPPRRWRVLRARDENRGVAAESLIVVERLETRRTGGMRGEPAKGRDVSRSA